MGTSALQDVNAGERLPGTIIAEKYVLVEKLDEDALAALYRVETVDAQEPRLLRLLNARSAEDPVIAREFREVGERVRKISHPNLAVLEAMGEAEGRPFVVTGAVEGRTLEELIQDERPLDPARVCAIACEIAAALEAAHRFGVLHLGLSPRQIIIQGVPGDSGTPGEEHVTVNGLGWAQLRMSGARRFISGDVSSGRSLTIQDLLPAAPAYSAPETALSRSPEGIDGRADLYSLGVLTYELLTGRLPRSAAPPDDDGLSMLVAQVDPLPSAVEFDTSIPAPLTGLIRQLLETRRELRPSTAKVVKEWFSRATVAAGPALPARDTVASRQKQPLAIPKPVPVTVPQPAPNPVIVESQPAAADPPIPEPMPPPSPPPQEIGEPPAALMPEPIASHSSLPATIGPPALPMPEPASESLPQPLPEFLAVAVTEPLPERAAPIPEPIAPQSAAPDATIEPPVLPMLQPASESLPHPMPEFLAEPSAEREAPAEQVIAEQGPAPEVPPEPLPTAADVFAELSLEPPASSEPPAPPAPIVLRPGGRVVNETSAAAGPMTAPAGAAQSPVRFGSPYSVLFKTRQEPQSTAGWGRRVLAALAVVLIFAAALFFIRESKKLHWNSPTPTSVDQEHSLSRPDANAEVTPSTSPAKSPSNTVPASTAPSSAAPATITPSTSTPGQTQPENSTPSIPESAGATGTGQNPATGTAEAGKAPATGVQATSGAHRAPLQQGAGEAAAGANKADAQNPTRAAADAAAAEIRRAVSAGDIFYQTGQYDLAIQTYDQALRAHSQSDLLRSRIARARKAKAAEQEYLGQ